MRGKTGADREISVNTYTGGFTTMLNHHLRNRNLSLKAVGLLSKMLSLPPDWDYSIRGLATLNTDGIDGIRTAMKELEDEGYVVRVQSRDERGRMSRNKYTVYALPQKEKPSPDLPSSENPTTVKPPPDEPMTEKPTQINTNQVIPKKRNDSLSKYCSSKSCSFCLWEDNKFFSSKKKKLTKKIAKELLDKGWCRVTGLYTPKKPQLYDAVIRLDDTGGKYVSFKMEFDR